MFIASNRCYRIGPNTPICTTGTIVIFVATLSLVTLVPDYSPEWIGLWGYVSARKIYHGMIWGVLTSSFVHFEISHVLANIIFFYPLCRGFEEHVGTVNTIFFVLLAAAFSEAFVLVFDNSLYGASGIVYSLFGYALVARKSVKEFARLLNRKTNLGSLFLWFLVLGLPLGLLNNAYTEEPISNAAHFSGFALGCLAGLFFEGQSRRKLAWVSVGFLTITISASLIYAPWSSQWWYSKGERAFAKTDYPLASQFFDHVPETSAYYPFVLCAKAHSEAFARNHVAAIRDLAACLNSEAGDISRAQTLNHLAWILATSPEAKLRDPTRAIALAKESNGLSKWKNCAGLDTLAAANAAAGRFDEAVNWQEKAIAIAKEHNRLDELKQFEARLTLFRNRQAYEESRQ